jgi:hypothetical protein
MMPLLVSQNKPSVQSSILPTTSFIGWRLPLYQRRRLATDPIGMVS